MTAGPIKMIDAALGGSGMTEAVDYTLLGPDQLAYMQNARIRKPGRVGKRNGYLIVPLLRSDQVVTPGPVIPSNGSLSGKFCGLGDRICVVNDTAYSWSETKQIWWDQLRSYTFQGKGNGIIAGVANVRAPFGHVSGWRVRSTAYSGYQEKGGAAAVCNVDTAVFDGLLWVSSENTAATGLGTDIQVMALDQTSGRVVYQYHANGEKPRLVVVGSFLLLMYIDAGANLVATQFIGYNAAFGRGLSLGAVLAPRTVSGTPTVASGYAVVAFSSTQALCAFQSAAGTITLRLMTLSAGDIVLGTTTNYNPAAAGPYYMNLAADPGNGEVLTWFAAGTNNTYAREFNTSIAAINAEINFGGGIYRPAALYTGAGGNAVIVWNVGPGQIRTAYISGGAMTHRMFVAGTWNMVAQPFYASGSLYCWVESDLESTTSLQRYLFLLKLDDPVTGTWLAAGPDVTYTPGFELTIQDTLISYAQDIASGQMWLGKTSVGTSGYVFAAPFQRSTPGTANNTALRVITANHYSESVRRRSIDIRPCRGGQVMAGGVLSMFYSTGAYEVGFLNAPFGAAGAGGAGGSLTPGATYFYTLVYRWVNPLGETELSAPSAQSKIVLGGAQNRITLATNPSLYSLGNKSGVALDIYRSTGGSVFFYVGTADMNSLTYVDDMSDATASANGVLYVQVGQELENRAPPACRFTCVSQNRLWLGGLPDSRVIQSSKAFQKGVAIAFADDDSFRVTLPDECTGLAFMDSMIAFTRNAIYVIGGDGPDNSGANGWESPVALPFPIGCADYRSVAVTEEGVFFQSDRGFYMLPRGFGEPVPAGDAIMEQIRTYPICCGNALVTRGDGTTAASSESTIRWAMAQEEAVSHGVLFVYDRVHKAWSVDTLTNPGLNQNGPAFVATWTDGLVGGNAAGPPGGRMALTCTDTTPQFSGGGAVPFLREITPGENPITNGFADDIDLDVNPTGNTFTMVLRTGQVRPFGLLGHGSVNRVGLIGYPQDSSTVFVGRTTDRSAGIQESTSLSRPAGTRNAFGVFELGSLAQRDLNFIEIELSQTNNTEGFQFKAFALDTGKYEGMRNMDTGDRA